jgi:hypothetical protein
MARRRKKRRNPEQSIDSMTTVYVLGGLAVVGLGAFYYYTHYISTPATQLAAATTSAQASALNTAASALQSAAGSLFS